MYNTNSWLLMLIVVAVIMMPVAIVGIVFWYKARKMQLDLQQSLRLREFDHQQRLKELELEIEKARTRNSEKLV
ncbi:MAG TPA: hypothetical protein VMW54_12500 [Terriglobia bacterium]|nr:hypothetical protein [Terriglobia bacterium]